MAKKEFSPFQARALAVALLLGGAWFLHKPVVAVAWLIRTGELPVLQLKRREWWSWFETFVPPLSVEGFKSWIAYALLVIFGLFLWTMAMGLLGLMVHWRGWRTILNVLHYSIYALFAAVFVIILFDWRIL